MEKALRDVTTAVTGYLQAKCHGEVVGVIASECTCAAHSATL